MRTQNVESCGKKPILLLPSAELMTNNERKHVELKLLCHLRAQHCMLVFYIHNEARAEALEVLALLTRFRIYERIET